MVSCRILKTILIYSVYNNLYIILFQVLLFTWNLTNHQNITGFQMGAYFGYAVAVGDINGDRKDDLIIGAPMHTEPNSEGKYEVGRVYVLYQSRAVSQCSDVKENDPDCNFYL